MNIFEQATRAKLRFPSIKGQLTVEDLWDLPLTSAKGACLDTVAKTINKELKQEDEESFVAPASNSLAKVLEVKLSIVKRIIEIKQEENAAARHAMEAKKQRETLLNLRESKIQEQMSELTVEEIDKKLAELS